MPPTTPRQSDRPPPNTGARRSRDTSNTTPSSSSTQPPYHHTALSDNHVYGVIMWLPPEDEIQVVWGPDGRSQVTSTGALCGLEGGCYNHPVLVLSPVPTNSSITSATARRDSCRQEKNTTILIITSFGGRDIMEKYPSHSNAEKRKTYLPISPAGRHPDLTDIPLLRLEADFSLAKKSYVNITSKYNIDRQALRDYRTIGNRGGDHRDGDISGLRYVLTRESYLVVARQAEYNIPAVSAAGVSCPVALPSPPPSPSMSRSTVGYGTSRQVPSPPSTTAAQRLGLTNATRGILACRDIPSNIPQPPTTTLFQNFQAQRVRPDVLNPGRGSRVAAGTTEVTPLLPVHVYQSGGWAGRRSGSPRRRHRDGYYPVGRAPPPSELRDGLIVVGVGLALLTGAGCGVWAAWVYRAPIGRGLLVSGRWLVENGWKIIKTVLKFGWRLLLSAVKWLGGVVKGTARWAWEKLNGVLRAIFV
ncbi:hypothetical protein QBC37DRAFT_59212 [Rhypophila decipiens]|uniref:Uncharacterized protein n=1 Tax=Rhypophila decipiens TaxID=261697 RepID=A0AAN6XYK2_9PEZI|nr:hypothetical protein QBC37DRAFT_59212 [Rhypophila decipiens]